MKISFRFLLSCCAVLLGGWTAILQAKETQTHVPVELSFTSEQDYADPFHDVILDVVFTGPEGDNRKVPAFWAGGDVWKVRLSSAQTGTHRWETVASAANDPGLHGQKGEIEVRPYTGDNPLFRNGPVRITADRRHFEHADGTPFLWLGDTWWMGLSQRLRWPDEFGQLAESRKRLGFNVIQIVAGLYPDMPAFDPRGANEAGFPWEEDFARLRPEYFEMADRRLWHLVEQGMTPCIVGAWGYFLPWMGEEKMKAHWRHLIARYAAWPVIWCAAGEANLPWYRAEGFPYDDQTTARRWCGILRHIRETDPWRRPLTIHPTAIHAFTARHVVDDANLLDFDFLQTPHLGPIFHAEKLAADTVLQSRAGRPVMPVINGEGSYEALMDTNTAERVRAVFWLCMMNGAVGHTYGANGIWQLNRPGDPHGPSPSEKSAPTGYGVTTWEEAMQLPGGRQIAEGMRWLATLSWWDFEPHPNWVAWADKAPAPVAPCGIGTVNGPRVFYMMQNRPVDLRQLNPGQSYRVTLFDPAETRATDVGTLPASKSGTLRIEAPSHGHDWILLLQPESP